MMESYIKLLDQLPLDVQTVLKKHEADGKIDNAEYKQARMVFSGRYLCRMKPLPEELIASMKALQEDPTVNHTMYA